MENYTMHRQWRSRPEDERFASLQAMYEHLLPMTHDSGVTVVQSDTLRVSAEGEKLALVGEKGVPAEFTNWSLNQMSSIVGAPATYLRTLPTELAAANLNHGLSVVERSAHQLYIRRGDEGLTLRAINSPSYSRVLTVQVLKKLMALQNENSSWKAPMVYPNGDFGGEKQPTVGYASDRDAYVVLIDEDHRIADPTSQEGLARGIMLVNSEVGAKRLDLTLFLMRYICGNFIIWGYKQIASFSYRHIGERIQKEWANELGNIFHRYANSSSREETAKIQSATQKQLGPAKTDIVDLLFSKRLLSKQQAADAYDLAEQYEPDPRTAWGMAQGITRLSQVTPFADARFDLDRAATKVLEF